MPPLRRAKAKKKKGAVMGVIFFKKMFFPSYMVCKAAFFTVFPKRQYAFKFWKGHRISWENPKVDNKGTIHFGYEIAASPSCGNNPYIMLIPNLEASFSLQIFM